MKKVVITGATGMVGSTMIDYILENYPEYDIVAFKRRHSSLENIEHLLDNQKVFWEVVDIQDSVCVNSVIDWHKPEKLFHLAGQSYVPQSWKSPAETIETNIIGAVNILEGVRRYAKDCVVQLSGSSEEYGLVLPDEVPIKETNPLRPLSPYGMTKVAQENLGYIYHKSYGVKTILTRGFNHEGPRRGEEFVTAQICKQAAEIAMGKRDKFYLGNLEAKRDYTDVRDMVRAYWILTEKGEFGTPYNICSENCYAIKGLVHSVAKLAHISEEVVQDPNRMRPADVEILYGNCSKLKAQTGWKPEYDFLNDTMPGMYSTWVEKITGKPEVQFFVRGE